MFQPSNITVSSTPKQFEGSAVPVSYWRLLCFFSLWMGKDSRSGDAGTDTYNDWCWPSHVSIFWGKKTSMYVSCMYLWASTTRYYFNMDNGLLVLLTLVFLLADVVQLNAAFYCHATTAYMCRKDLSKLQQFPCSALHQPCIYGNKFMNGVVVPEGW